MKSITQAYLKVISGNKKVEEVKTKQLTETTVPEHLHHIPESWDHHGSVSEDTQEKIRAAMTKGSFTHFPLNDEHGEGDPDVIEHLTNHGYEIKDYKKGIATIKKQVGNPEKGIPFYHKNIDESIGSVLNKTNATQEIKTSFMNDPSRASAKSKTHVVISTSPLALAGMSTGTTWRDQSCMNMEGGALNHKLEDDSINGTHVAFLVHHDDTTAFQHGEPSKPIARIALKPFHSGSDTIYRPENKTYGTDTSAFTTAVSRWASDNYPAEPGKTYIKNADVHDDTNNSVYKSLSKDKVEWHIKNGVQFEPHTAIDNDTINHAIDFTKNHFDDKAVERNIAIQHIAGISNLATSHVLKLNRMTDDSETKNKLVFKHGDKASTSMMNEFMTRNSSDNRVPRKMLMNPKLTDEHLDKAEPEEYPFVRRSLLKDKHMTKLIDHTLSKAYLSTADKGNLHNFKDKLKPEHLIQLTKHDTLEDVVPTIINSTHFNKDVHDGIVNEAVNRLSDPTKYKGDSVATFQTLAKESKFATIADIERMPTDGMYNQLAQNPHIPSDVHKQLKDMFMKNSTGGNPDARSKRFTLDVFGFGTRTIPKNISDHMTTNDYDKLTDHNYATSFEDKKASNEFLDASERKMKSLDDHASHLYSDADISDEHFDKFHKARKELQSHIENHADNLEDHVSKHVINDEGTYDDHEEHARTLDRIEGVDNPNAIYNVEHYSHPEQDEALHDSESAESHRDYVAPILRGLKRITSKSWD
jgi:hypothetical protein